MLAFEENEFLEKDIAERVSGEWKAIYKETTAMNSESITAVFRAVLEFIQDQGGTKLGDIKDDGPPKLCTIL